MSVTIAMPRMSTDPELTTAQSKYVESLARAGAEVHWVELSDPDAAAAEAQAGTATVGGGMGGGMQPGAAPDGGSGKFGGDRPTGTPPEKPRQA